MNHWLIAPIVLPAFIGPLIIMWMRHDLVLQRIFSLAATVAQLGIALYLLSLAAGGDIHVYRLGNWAVPFGIALLLDRLAAMMLVLTAMLAIAVQLYVIGSGWDRKGWHFHALYQFQLMGLMGAFLTSDAFNLFVFFEILLIASYGLMAHGGGEMRLRAAVQYVIYNLAGSTLFLAALGTLYAATGTLNMIDMAQKVADMPADDTALLRVGAVLLMLVFAVKAALVPLHFWLPSTYANAPGPVAALFAIMTKVGIYGIVRVYTLVFPTDGPVGWLIADLLLPAALLTLVLGQIGVLGSRNLNRMTAFATIASVGTLVIAVAQLTPQAISAGLWYLIHSTFAAAALFLVVDLAGARRERLSLWLQPMPPITQSGLTASLFMAAAVGIAGLPPLSGFVGKLAILQATRDAESAALIWAAILVTSLLAIVGLARAGSIVFWKGYQVGPEPPAVTRPDVDRRPLPTKVEPDEVLQDVGDSPSPVLAFAAAGALIAGLVALTAGAGPVMRYTDATAGQLFDLAPYVDAVLVRQEGAR
ncbi:monovalent cation/H+ antiporter subunit D [uncultured Paracoccus sp.]|uniref:monovalent cation/H+ antiporter subunit D n=1 Tax=uncultured Paracoccus sp. TaxID=189685 RepID=UPI0026396357|nr:monovalent cation/H+ antiporter subunit D [uncultured Paracoccus sp.]